MPDLEARSSGRGRWRERLQVIVEALVALGRLRATNEAASDAIVAAAARGLQAVPGDSVTLRSPPPASVAVRCRRA